MKEKHGKSKGKYTVLSATVLAIGIAASGFFISDTLYKSKVALNTADVKGLAERRVKSDIAYWTIGYTVSGDGTAKMAKLYAQSEADQNKIIKLLTDSGFSAQEISRGVINYYRQEYRNEQQQLVEQTHVLNGEIEVQTHQVDLVATVRAKLNKLISEGLSLQNNPPLYYFTKLNDIKPDMLKEATTNARVAANEFAENAGVKVGGIRSAVQGGFVIRDVGSSYGDSQKIDKDVRVVTSITFFLTE